MRDTPLKMNKCPYNREVLENGQTHDDDENNETVPHNNPQEGQAVEKCPVWHPSQTMKAARLHQLGGLEHIKIEDVPVPSPRENEVLIRIFTIGVSPCDAMSCRASTPSSEKKELPFVIGTSCAGIIEKVGANVTKFMVGERVYASLSETGTYANFTVTKAAWTHHLHDNLGFSQGAALGFPYHAAFKSLFKIGKSKAGATVLIHGAYGGIELASAQIAKAYGVKVVVTADTEQGCHLVKQNGAIIATNHNQEDYVKYLKAITRDQGYDLIIEMAAHRNIQADIGLLKRSGTIVVIGSNGNTKIDFESLMAKEAKIFGYDYLNESEEDAGETSAALYAGMAQGWLKPVIADEFPLSEAVEALRKATEDPPTYNGTVIMSPV